MEERYILLVEDNPDDRDLTLRALKRGNVHNTVLVARDGAEAVSHLLGDERGPLPAVVLLDLHLPKLSGLEVLRRLREHARTRYLPVVILTASREEWDRVEGYRLGCNSFVSKPVDFAEFSRAVGQLGLYWALLNEAYPNGVTE